MSALGIDPDITLQDLLEVASSDQWSIAYSPMAKGPAGEIGATFVRQAAPHKGFTKLEEETLNEYYDRLESAGFDGVSEGLQAAQAIRQEHNADGQKQGVVLLKKDGVVSPVSRGAADMCVAQGNGTIVGEGYTSVADAIEAMPGKGGRRPRFPSAF